MQIKGFAECSPYELVMLPLPPNLVYKTEFFHKNTPFKSRTQEKKFPTWPIGQLIHQDTISWNL